MQRVGESELGHGMFERDVDPADKTISPVEKALQNSSEDMSIENEMLLERLAVATSAIKKDGRNPMPDDNSLIVPFCETIEMIFRRGLKRGLAVIGLKDCDYWNCLEGFLTSTKIEKGLPQTIRSILSIIQQSDKVYGCTGRGRLFIRIAMVKGYLAATIEYLLRNSKFLRYWYNDSSVFLDKNQTECIIGIIKALSHIKFSLRITVCSFLHEDWIIPETKKLELIPCEKLGVTVCCIHSKCVVVAVQPGSIAKEYDLAPGDCFDEFCGIFITEKLASQMSTLLKANKGQPISATVIKGRFHDNRWFTPLHRRYKTANPEQAEQVSPREEIKKDESGRSTFEVSYVASVDVGKNGSSKIVQEGIRKALEEKENESNKIEKEVVIALMERDIVVTDRLTEESLGLYSYTKTSSCGLGEEKHGLFGFITGNTSCSFANKFVCHVFRAPNHDTAQDIITGIGRGFNRTLYCV